MPRSISLPVRPEMTKSRDEQAKGEQPKGEQPKGEQPKGEGGKHVHYEDPISSASDDDMKAFEVTFDPSNPYRRKSSLVSTESSAPNLAKRSKKTQCLVHKLLENPGARSHTFKTVGAHVDGNYHDKNHERKEDATGENGLQRLVEPKGTDRPQTLDQESENSTDAGQVDEKEWKKNLSKRRSDENITAAQGLEAMHSRLLTKKQLSEMAWGVRELSRRLGNMRLKFKAKSIFILTKACDYALIPKTRELTRWLLSKDREVRYTVYLEHSLRDSPALDIRGLLDDVRNEYVDAGVIDKTSPKDIIDKRLRFWDEEMCRARPHTFDFVITLGGDGTVLYASWLFQRIVPPVLSFSLGSLGFLTKFDFTEYPDILTKAFNEGVTVSLRLRFEGTVMRTLKKKRKLQGPENIDPQKLQKRPDLVEELIGEERENEHTHKPDGTYEILNEIVVDRGPNPSKFVLQQPTQIYAAQSASLPYHSNVLYRNIW